MCRVLATDLIQNSQSRYFLMNPSQAWNFIYLIRAPRLFVWYTVARMVFWAWTGVLVRLTHWPTLFVQSLPLEEPRSLCVWSCPEQQQAAQRREESKLLEGGGGGQRRRSGRAEGCCAQGKQVSVPFQEEECFTVAFVFCFLGFFLAMNHFSFLKSLLDLLQYCFWYMFWFFWPPGLWHLSSLTREWSHSLCTGRRNLNPWNSGEVPIVFRTLPYTLFVHFYPPSLIFSVCFHSKMEYPDRLKSPQMNILSEGQTCLSILNKMLSICLHHKRNMLAMRALKQKVRKK